MRQLDMCHLKLDALLTQKSVVFALVELEGLSRSERQGNKGAAARRLLLALAICPRLPRKGRYPAIGAGEAKLDEIGMHLLQRPPLLTRLAGIRLQPASFSAKGSSLLERSGVAKDGLIAPEFRYFLIGFRDRPGRRVISQIGNFSCSRSFRMTFKSPMWIIPLTASGKGHMVKSQ